MAAAGVVTLVIDAASVPLLPGAYAYAKAGAIPGGLRNNMDFAGFAVGKTGAVDPVLELLLSLTRRLTRLLLLLLPLPLL